MSDDVPTSRSSVEDRIDYSMVKLGPEPYVSWKIHMTNVLISKGFEQVVAGKQITETVRENQAQALIRASLDKVNRMNIIDCTTAGEIWKRLQNIHEVKTSFETQSIQTKLNTYRMASVGSISESLAEIRYLAAKLRMMGEAVSDSNLMSIILQSLPKALHQVRTSWKIMSASERTLENLVSFILSEAADLDKPEEAALMARRRGSPKGRRFRGGNSYKKPSGKKLV